MIKPVDPVTVPIIIRAQTAKLIRTLQQNDGMPSNGQFVRGGEARDSSADDGNLSWSRLRHGEYCGVQELRRRAGRA